MKGKQRFFALCGMTAFALLLHGYHPGAEDAAIYLPAVKKDLHPDLYPFGAGFFMSHAHLTLFDDLVALSVRLTHVPLPIAILAWHLCCIFLLMAASFTFAQTLFKNDRDAWTGTALLASLLTLPAAGTALLIMDPYLTPRSLSTPLILLAVIAVLKRKWLRAVAVLVLSALVHPLMAVFGVLFCFTVGAFQRGVLKREPMARNMEAFALADGPQNSAALKYLPGAIFPSLLSPSFTLTPVSAAYHSALMNRPYFFVTHWTWYEWLGVVGPLLIFLCIAKVARTKGLHTLSDVCCAAVLFGTAATVAGLMLCASTRLEPLAELQPMRAFHLLYVVFFLVAGGMLSRFVLRRSAIRLLLLLLPIGACMFLVQRNTFAADAHIEWPGAKPRNPWVRAFLWIRDHTPPSALFALDPDQMNLPGEDNQGFRALAERSMLAEDTKDTGAVTMFPALAADWMAEVGARKGWRHFRISDFERLSRAYGVSWVLLHRRPVTGLTCPYSDDDVQVCKLPSTATNLKHVSLRRTSGGSF
jgi:hypothetical protein